MTSSRVGEKSPETLALRKKIQDGCEQLIWDFFNSGGQVIIYDANNGTRERRHTLAEKFDKEGIHVVMLGQLHFLYMSTTSEQFTCAESLCDNEEIIMANIRSVKISSPDVRNHFVGLPLHKRLITMTLFSKVSRMGPRESSQRLLHTYS